MKLHTAYLSIFLFAIGAIGQMPQERQILVTPNAEQPQAAKDSGLGGNIRVAVTVDRAGNVISVGEATGPGNICPSVTRPDVVALRESAKAAAVNAKFTPSNAVSTTTMYLNFEFPTDRTYSAAADDAAYIPPISKHDGSASTKPGKNERFTVKGDRDFEVANPPPDYTGPEPIGRGGGSGSPNLSEKSLSGGVLNGKAVSLPRPPFPPAARAVRASGAVTVQVLIYEDGNVFSAAAVSGHPLLRASARNAACSAVFSPTYLAGNPVKVSGVITYNFVP